MSPTFSLPSTRSLLAGAGVAALVVLAAVTIPGLGSRQVDPPAPTREAVGSWVPELPTSTLRVPLRYELSPVIRSLEGAVPTVLGSLGERIPVEGEDRVHVAYEVSRDAFQASLIADRAMIGSVLRYRARAWYDPPLLPEIRTTCGTREEPLRAVVSLSARIWISEDWLLRGDSRVDHVAPLSETDRDKCQLTALSIDVTDRVMRAARRALEEHLPVIEGALSRVDLRSKFEGWWQILGEPIRLTDDTWLVIDPVGVHRGPTRGNGRTLTAEIGLSARPRIIYGGRPQAKVEPLPPLSDPLDQGGLRIRAAGTADYEAASRFLTETLQGRTIRQQGQELRLERLEVTGIGGGRLALDVHFTGSARGHVYLVGTPEIDPRSGEIFVPDLSFDVESMNLLLQGYAWIAEEEILEFFRERARWPVDDLARFAGEQLHRGLNRSLSPDARLEGEVASVELLGVYPLLDELVIQAEAIATASLIIAEVAPPAGQDR